jgi:S-adenosylmethionine-dependent methyltransferase
MALQLAQKQHQLTLCDLSANMLEQARLNFAEHNIDDVTFIHTPVQQPDEHIDAQFDVVIFHAVLEWLAQPEQTLKQLLSFIRPGGYLSLMFYSRTGLIYQNLSRGNFNYVLDNTLAGEGKTLTPTNPQEPEDVYRWIEDAGLNVLAKSGIRVFYDNISRERRKQINKDELLELEKRFSRIEPYCSLARYVHVLCQKPC